jgi:hypothetical protein
VIDTIKLAWLLLEMPNREVLAINGWRARFNQYTGELAGWELKDKDQMGEPRMQIFHSRDGMLYLTVLVSLPCFANGTNAVLLTQGEVDEALGDLASYVSAKTGRRLQMADARVWQVDIAEDLHFKEETVSQVICLLSQMQIPGFRRGRYSDTTIYFHSGREKRSGAHPRSVCIYAKQRERMDKGYVADLEIAAGRVRIEYRFRKTSAIKHFVKTNNLADMSPQSLIKMEVSTKILNPIIQQAIGLLETVARRDVIGVLRSHYSLRRTATLLAHLVYLDHYGPNFYRIEALSYQRSKYFDCQRACRAAGIYGLSVPVRQTP